MSVIVCNVILTKYNHLILASQYTIPEEVEPEILVSEWACATTVRNDVISLEVDLDKRLN